jgi:predicted O-methyltransferase YrrM
VRAELRDLLDELHREGVELDASQADRLNRRRNLDPDSAAFLRLLILSSELRSVLEIGTSNGYSTIWFCEAVSHTGGRVTSVDTDADAVALARANLERAGLAGVADLRVADGGDTLRQVPAGSVDLLFLDAERTEYAGWWPHPRRALAPRGVMVVDNVLSHPDEVAGFLGLVEGDPGLWSVVVPTGKGMLLATAEPT